MPKPRSFINFNVSTIMPNFIDHQPINNVIQEKITRVHTEQAKHWFSRNVRNWLSQREDCAQLITLGEENLPEWAKLRLQAGQAVHRFIISSEANGILTDCLRYIRALEYALDKDVEITVIHEANRRLKQVRNITPDNIGIHYQTWRIFTGDDKEDRSMPVEAQIEDENTNVDATEDRVWERIITFDGLEQTGRELRNCLADGHYDIEFEHGVYAFWRLNDKHGKALAVMRIDQNYTAVEFKTHDNCTAEDYADDALMLFEAKDYKHDNSEDFFSIGIATDNETEDTSSNWQNNLTITDKKTFDSVLFYKTDKGIVIEDDGQEACWIMRQHNIRAGQGGRAVNVYRLSDSGLDVIAQLESNPKIAKKFWSWVDVNGNMGPSYSQLVEATGNAYCSNLQPEGWFSATDKKSWSTWQGNIPNLPDNITIKQRWVFDEEGCNSLRVEGTQQKRDYALQIAIFVNKQPEISCLILAERNKANNWQRFFKLLTNDFKSPSAVAALFSVLWIEMESTAEKNKLRIEVKNLKIQNLIEQQQDLKPYYYAPRHDFNQYCNDVMSDEWDREGEYTEIYSIDANGNILWTADKNENFLESPIIYQDQDNIGIKNAIRYIQDHGFRVTNEWQPYLSVENYIHLNDGGIRSIVAPFLNKLETEIDNQVLRAVRVLDENEYTWRIEDEEGEALWTLSPANNPQYSHWLELKPSERNNKGNISSGSQSLIHAILDGCGKTMSPIQLGILGLMPLSNGGHISADTKIFPLSLKKISINEHLVWVQKYHHWYLIKEDTWFCRCAKNFVLPASTPITEDIASAMIYFSHLLQQAEQLPFTFRIASEEELATKFPEIEFRARFDTWLD